MGLGPHRAFLASAAAVFAASVAACSAVLGLDAPTLDVCALGCPDSSVSSTDASGSSSGGDSSVPPDAASESAAPDATPDATPDAIPDVIPDRGPSTGVRCGTGPAEYFCAAPTPLCCLDFEDGGSPMYSCVSGVTACTGYPIECASDNDCAGSDVCCFYHSGIKCEPEGTASCASALVCDPSDPASDDECNTGQTCSVAYLFDGGSLPYYGCN